MTNIYLFDSLSDFLRSELDSRKSRNPNYSLRAFARDLDVSFSRLSEQLNKKEGMSARTADKIGSALQLSQSEKGYFALLITSGSGRTKEIRDQASQKIKSIRETKQVAVIRNGFAGLLSKWYYIPLIELLGKREPPPLAKIAHSLAISEADVLEAVNQLEIAGYISAIDPGGWNWKKTAPIMQIESSNPQQAIRDFHKKFIETGAKALKQPINKRKFLSTVMGIRHDSIEDARRDLENFNRDFIAKYASESSAEAVYGMNLQFFEFEDLRS